MENVNSSFSPSTPRPRAGAPATNPTPPVGGTPAKGDSLVLSKAPTQVRREAEHLMFKADHAVDSTFRHVVRTAIDVNAPSDPKRDARARELLAQHQAAEQEALQKLSAPQQAEYKTISSQLQGHPVSQLAFQVLLLDGKLAGNPLAHDRSTLLDNLDHLAEKPLHKAIDRSKLLQETVQEVAFPSAIDQQDRGTCAVTSVQILMASKHPAEYARIIAGLASAQGKVRLANGSTLHRQPGSEKPEKLIDTDDDGKKKIIDDKRSTPSRLWQVAMMQYGVGGASVYSNKKDAYSDGSSGMDDDGIQRVVSGLTGHAPKLISGEDLPPKKRAKVDDQMIAHIQNTTASGTPVLVGVQWGDHANDGKTHDSHEILITRIQDDRVYYNNPWGIEENMDLSEFKQRVEGAVFPRLETDPTVGRENKKF